MFITRRLTNNMPLITKLAKISQYSFSSIAISELKEVVEGQRYLQQKNIKGAQEMLSRSLNILPFYMQGNQHYNQQFDSLLAKLSKVYAWKGQINKIVEIAQKNIHESANKQIILGRQMNRVNVVLSTVGKLDYELNKVERVVQDSYEIAKNVTEKRDTKIEEILTAPKQQGAQNTEDLQIWNRVSLQESWLFILTRILGKSTLPCNSQYNKLCSSLLKSAQKDSKNNIIKPLILMISNLLRNEQYLQAQGMLSYCLDQKKQLLPKDILYHNQQYILLNLLLAKSFRGVKRQEQAERLQTENRILFKPQTLMVQGLLLDSI